MGEKEEQEGSINVRSRDGGELGEMAVAAFLSSLAEERLPGAEPRFEAQLEAAV